MPFPSAISAGNLTKLRGDASTQATYSSTQYMSLNANTTVFAARVNQASFAASFAQVTYDTVTTGAYTDIEDGMTVLLSSSNDRRAAYFVGRVRKTPTSSVLYINETSAAVSDNDYIFVLDDYRMHEKLAREVSGVQRKDYDRTYTRIPPVITNLQSAYAGVVSGTPAGLTIRFQPTAIAPTSGATISSYAFTIASGMTVTAGSENSNDVTIRFDAGEYWLALTVTDSNGLTTTRRIKVWAVPANLSGQIATGFSGGDLDNALEVGATVAVEAFDGISSVLDNTLCCIWEVENYNGTDGPILANVKFVGRLRRETNVTAPDERFSQLQTTSYELEGPGTQLARITAPLLALRNKSNPTKWDQIKDMTIWREICHVLHEHTTFLNLHALTFDDTGTTYRDKIYSTQGENALAVINDLASGYNAAIEFTPQGETRVVRDARFMDTTDRAALTTIINFTTADVLDWSLEVEHVEIVGRVEASGATYNNVNDKVTPVLSVAPGVAQGSGEGRVNLARQILKSNQDRASAQSELNTRAGQQYALSNARYRLNVTHPDGYDFITPSRYQWYTFTLPATENTAGRAFTTSNRWLCESMSAVQDTITGTKQIEAVYVLETSGAPGQSVEFPAQNEGVDISSGIPPLPPFPSFPPPPDIYLPIAPTIPPPYVEVETDGNRAVAYTASHIWSTTEYLRSSAPSWLDITPAIVGSNGTLIKHAARGIGDELYALLYDGTRSQIAHRANAFATGNTYSLGTLLPGEYETLRAASTQGQVYAINPDTGSGPIDYSDDYWLTQEFNGSRSFTATSNAAANLTIPLDKAHPGAVGVLVVWSGTISGGAGNLGVTTDTHAYWSDGSFFTFMTQPTTSASGSHVFINPSTEAGEFPGYTFARQPRITGSPPLLPNQIDLDFRLGGNFGGGGTITFEATCRLIIAKTTEAYPGGAVANPNVALAAYSDDYGATMGTITNIGSPIVSRMAGLDTIKIGTLALAGSDNQTVYGILDGAWAAYGANLPAGANPSAAHIPRYAFGSTVNSNAGVANPEYLVASETLSSNAGLWRVTADGNTLTNITPQIGSDYGKAVHEDCLAMPWFSGQRIAAVLEFGSTRGLVTTEDSGTAWTDRGTLTSNATMVAFRRGDTLMRQLYYADGKPGYSPDYGATKVLKEYPADESTEPVIGVWPYD